MFGQESEQTKRVNEKVQEMLKYRTLVKQLVASIPDYQIRAWCKASQNELAGDIALDWLKYKDTLTVPDKELVVRHWKDVLQMTTNEVSTLVKNYGK